MFVCTCNNCKGNVETGFHCTVCDDFDLCVQCYDKDGHPHKMEKLGLDLDDCFLPSDTEQANPQETKCSMPLCLKLKLKLKQQQLVHRLHQAQQLKRSIAMLNVRSMQSGAQQAQLLMQRMEMLNIASMPSGALPGNSGTGVDKEQSGLMDGQPGTGGMVGLPYHQPAGSKPGNQTPTPNVQQVKQEQEEAACQQAPHTVEYGSVPALSVPGGQSQGMPPPPMSTIGTTNAPHVLPQLEQWSYGPNATLEQQSTGLCQSSPQSMQQVAQAQQQAQQLHLAPQQGMGHIPPILTPPQGGAGMNVAGTVEDAQQKLALQQLLQALRSPTSFEQQQQILHIVKSNPNMLAAFAKQRQAYLRARHARASQLNPRLEHMTVGLQQQQ